MKKKHTLFLIILTLAGAFLHFYNLNWGAPFYFHPDERNIASAVSQLQFPNQMNPRFFAYGSLPIYTIYFTGVLVNYFSNLLQPSLQNQMQRVTFEQAILVSRVYSALFATALIPLLFLIGKKLKNDIAGIISAFFAATSVGVIQFAHFGTFEMWLTFFSVLLFWCCLYLIKGKHFVVTILVALAFGVLMATKISSLTLALLPIFTLISLQKTKHKLFSSSILPSLSRILFFSLLAFLVYLLTNPYVIIDTKDFLSSMNYESSVALGTLPVFYTGNFLDTTPVLYQLLHVYPFLINPFMAILFIPSFIFIVMQTIQKKNLSYALLAAFYLILFVSQAFLFVKWTRYIIPTLPFMFLIIAIALVTFSEKYKGFTRGMTLTITFLVILNCIFAISYFKTAFIATDTRIEALFFAQHTISLDNQILAEPADLGIMPFQDAFPHVATFNFYDMDTNSFDATEEQLHQKLSDVQYIILPSQRILQSRIENSKRFPKGYRFYVSLFNGSLGFHKIYETPCDIFCQVTYLGDPIYWWEQTASVFDHPTVFIFKKES